MSPPIVLAVAVAGRLFVMWDVGGEAALIPATAIALYTVARHGGRIGGLVTASVAAIVMGEPERIWMMALGAMIALAAMWLIYIFSRGGMGDGDVRFAPLLGLYLGWLNPGIVLPGLFFGFLAGAVVGVVLMVFDRAGRRTAVPFGPFLALGTVVAIFVGQHFVDLVLAR